MAEHRTRTVVVAVSLLLGGLSLGACGSSDDSATAASTASTTTVDDISTTTVAPSFVSVASKAKAEGRTVIDVRRDDEWMAGHVEGAVHMDIESAGFDQAMAGLDPSKAYVVYCHSGRRAGIAAQKMATLGLDVVNGGGFVDMQAAGWPAA